jgi:GPH family glycoside/pentoside/hexuronide:cation symporter
LKRLTVSKKLAYAAPAFSLAVVGIPVYIYIPKFYTDAVGVYIGLWSVAKKLAAAAGVGAGLALLGVSGYDPNIKQSPAVVTTLRVLYTLVPCLCNGLAMAVALRYPLTREVHQQIHRQLERRLAGQPFVDPLA